MPTAQGVFIAVLDLYKMILQLYISKSANSPSKIFLPKLRYFKTNKKLNTLQKDFVTSVVSVLIITLTLTADYSDNNDKLIYKPLTFV